MARLYTTGAEWNDSTAESVSTLSSATFSTANPRTGTYAYRETANSSGPQFTVAAFVIGTTYFLRAYLFVSALPASAFSLAGMGGGGGTTVNMILNTDGSVSLRSSTNVIATTAPGAFSTGGWQLVELAGTPQSGASASYMEAKLNGVSIGSTLVGSWTTVGTLVTCGGSDGTVTTDLDDVGLNDSTGLAQNSWLGSGKVLLLRPASDNAKGTGWTDDNASTTNLFNDVDNTPPAGIADTTAGGGGHQLRNATSNANSNYDANLETYTAAGIGATDTINVLVPMAATGAPVTTSSKQGTLGIVSNPTIANIALGAGGTAGAFWSGVAAGTYPTGWKWSRGTTTYAPSVTPGTAPVMRVTQVTASTRIAMACALGMYVDYTPAAKSLVFADRRVARNSLLRR